jgi:hypothetical protein
MGKRGPVRQGDLKASRIMRHRSHFPTVAAYRQRIELDLKQSARHAAWLQQNADQLPRKRAPGQGACDQLQMRPNPVDPEIELGNRSRAKRQKLVADFAARVR